MALNIKNPHVERLAAEIAKQTGETKTEAIRRSLVERKVRLAGPGHAARTRRRRAFFEREVWPLVPAALHGKRLTRREMDEILGYGPGGV